MPIERITKLLSITGSDFRMLYGACAGKKLVGEFGIAIATAAVWLSGRVPVARRRQIAAALIVELDRQDALRSAARQRWKEIVENEAGATHSEMLGARTRARTRMDHTETD